MAGCSHIAQTGAQMSKQQLRNHFLFFFISLTACLNKYHGWYNLVLDRLIQKYFFVEIQYDPGVGGSFSSFVKEKMKKKFIAIPALKGLFQQYNELW